jgi:hypothetical protein
LTGRSQRKPAPLQFHQAFSVRFFQPKDSPLRKEVDDLWKRRGEKEVIDLLAPFVPTEDPPNSRLGFHNAAMRWKCSLLTEEEQQEHQDWIDEDAVEKEKSMNQPWKALQEVGDDELSAENQYIQRYVSPRSPSMQRKLINFSSIDALPATIDKALQQIECSTGMKAIILIGGPTPAAAGDISTHW